MTFSTFPNNPFPPSSAQFDEGKNELATKTNLSNIAPTFDATSGVYAVGDKVIYNGVLYEFTSAHSTAGEWDESEVQPVKISELIDSLKNGLTVKQNIYGTATKLGDIDADDTLVGVTATKNGYLSLVYEMLTSDRSITGRIRDNVITQIGATFNITAKAYASEPICTIPCVNGQTYAIEVSAGHGGISIYQL